MIDVYSWPTPNGHKVHIMLEECGLPYRVHAVDIGKGDQFEPDFLAISPNNRIPAMVDSEGPEQRPIALFESGAMLIYLAEKTGQFYGTSPGERYSALQWLMWQMGGFGPMLGQAHHFRLYAPEPVPYGIERYTREAQRLYGVLERQLARAPWVAGEQYTIADMATFPWARSWKNQGVDLKEFPHVQAWFEAISQRPAVQRALEVLSDRRKPLNDERARAILFGQNPQTMKQGPA